MINKIFIIVFAVIFIGIIGVVLNSDKKDTRESTRLNTTEIAQNVSTETKAGEYVVDQSDMYTVEDVSKNNSVTILTEKEEKWLILMREEEKLARDVYLSLGDKWGVNIFSNIASSEQTHTDAIKNILNKYTIDDPVKNDVRGVFKDPTMQKLYNDLITQGNNSLLDALTVGATVEDLDIRDLDNAIRETNKVDINVVYQNLQKGSRNHIRAFVRQIEQNGGTYTPQYMSVSDYEKVISSQQERGRIQ